MLCHLGRVKNVVEGQGQGNCCKGYSEVGPLRGFFPFWRKSWGTKLGDYLCKVIWGG